MKHAILFLIICLSAFPLLEAQEAVDTASVLSSQPWTLAQCIAYAKKNNIQVRTQQVTKAISDVDLVAAKAQQTPTLSFRSSFNLAVQNATTYNEFMEKAEAVSYNDSYGLSAGWTLYNGGRIQNNIRQQQVQNTAYQYDVDQTKFDLEISVTQAYLQLLYANEALKTARLTADLSQAQVDRGQQMRDAGSISKGDLAQLQSQAAGDKYNVTTAVNTLANARLQLKQLLELGLDDPFDVYFPTLDNHVVLSPIPPLSTVYENALQDLPQMKSSALGMEAAELAVEVAKASKRPTLSLSAGINTGTSTGNENGYFQQLGTKLNENVGLSLSVPIFNNRQARTNISKAQLQVQTAQLQDLNIKKQLLSTLESLHNDAVSAQSQYTAANEQLDAAAISFEIVTEQFHAGLKNTIELITEENNYSNALISQLQAKFKAVLALKLLQIYQNQSIEL